MIIRDIDSPKPRLLSFPLNPTLNKMQPPATRKKLIKISQFSSSIQVIQPNHCLLPSILQKKAISIHLTLALPEIFQFLMKAIHRAETQ
jgi:hypothetical protein